MHLELLREEQARAEQEALTLQAFYKFYEAHPELSCDANTRLLTDFHHGEPISLKTLEESYQYLKDKKVLAVKTEARLEKEAERQRAEMIETILSVDMSPDQRKHLKATLESPYYSIEAIKRKAQEVIDGRAFRAMPVDKLRQVVKDSSTKYELAPLPESYDREWLLHCANFDLPKFKSLMTRHGSAAINARLKGE